MATAFALLDLAGFEALPENGMRQELSEGRLIEMPPPKWLHDRTSHRIHRTLIAAAGESRRGEALIEVAYLLQREPATVRIPDVSYASVAQLGATGDQDWVEGPPLLAVEVVSPSDSEIERDEKVRQYLASGCRLVWVVDPAKRELRIHSLNAPPSTLTGDDPVEAPELFPGWSTPVSRFWS